MKRFSKLWLSCVLAYLGCLVILILLFPSRAGTQSATGNMTSNGFRVDSSGRMQVVGSGDTTAAAMPVTFPTTQLDPCQDNAVAKQSIFKNISSATTTAVITSSASTVIYVCGYDIQMTSTVTADTLLLQDGTGAAWVTTQVPKTPTYNSGITTINISVGFGGQSVFQTAAGGEICAVSTVGTGPVIALMVTYVQQ